MKIGALLIFKNESLFLKNYMNNIKGFADFVVGYDDNSNDDSKDLFKKHGGILIDTLSSSNFANGGQDLMRNLVLEKGRSLGGSHFCVLDADERLFANSKTELKSKLNSLLPGQKLALDWINLWGDFETFCTNGWPWAPRKKAFFFRENNNMAYPIKKKHKDSYHLDRLPNFRNAPKWVTLDQPNFAILHLQHVNFEYAEIKKIWYQFIEMKKTPFASAHINRKYDDSRKKLATFKKVPPEWNAMLTLEKNSFNIKTDWRYLEILTMIEEYSTKYFEKLNVWDNEKLRELWFEQNKHEPISSFNSIGIDKIKWFFERVARKIR